MCMCGLVCVSGEFGDEGESIIFYEHVIYILQLSTNPYQDDQSSPVVKYSWIPTTALWPW